MNFLQNRKSREKYFISHLDVFLLGKKLLSIHLPWFAKNFGTLCNEFFFLFNYQYDSYHLFPMYALSQKFRITSLVEQNLKILLQIYWIEINRQISYNLKYLEFGNIFGLRCISLRELLTDITFYANLCFKKLTRYSHQLQILLLPLLSTGIDHAGVCASVLLEWIALVILLRGVLSTVCHQPA